MSNIVKWCQIVSQIVPNSVKRESEPKWTIPDAVSKRVRNPFSPYPFRTNWFRVAKIEQYGIPAVPSVYIPYLSVCRGRGEVGWVLHRTLPLNIGLVILGSLLLWAFLSYMQIPIMHHATQFAYNCFIRTRKFSAESRCSQKFADLSLFVLNFNLCHSFKLGLFVVSAYFLAILSLDVALKLF